MTKETVSVPNEQPSNPDDLFLHLSDSALDHSLAFFALGGAAPEKSTWERAIFDRRLPLERRRIIAEAYRQRFSGQASRRMRDAMQSACVEEREVAARTLSGHGAIEALAAALTSGNDALEDAAAEALSRALSVRATRLLAGRALDEVRPLRRAFFLRKMKALPGREADRVLLHFLADLHPDVRLSALYALGERDSAQSAAQSLQKDPDARVRMLALEISARLQTPLPDAGNDPDFAVRCAAAQIRLAAG